MLSIELVPDLDHCVETIAKQRHAELTQMLLEGNTRNSEAEEKLETLRRFLETADFRKLRSESEKQLLKGKRVRFMLYLKNLTLKYEMQVIQVNPREKSPREKGQNDSVI